MCQKPGRYNPDASNIRMISAWFWHFMTCLQGEYEVFDFIAVMQSSRGSRSHSVASAFDESTLNTSQFVLVIETFLGDEPLMEAFHQLINFIRDGYMETEDERMHRLIKVNKFDPDHEGSWPNIPAWISNYIHYQVWDEITYPFPNFNSTTVEVWEWKRNFIPHFTGHVMTYPCWDLS